MSGSWWAMWAANISTIYNNHIVIVSYMGTILYPIFLSLIMFMCVTRWVGGENIRRNALFIYFIFWFFCYFWRFDSFFVSSWCDIMFLVERDWTVYHLTPCQALNSRISTVHYPIGNPLCCPRRAWQSPLDLFVSSFFVDPIHFNILNGKELNQWP